MNPRLSRRSRPSEAGFLLIGLLIVIVIIGILYALSFGGGSLSPGGDSSNQMLRDLAGPPSAYGPQTVYGRTLEVAKGTVDRNNLQQARLAIQMFQGNNGRYPASLEELAKATPGLQLSCAETKKPYSYDPTTGRIWCAQPGHERY